MGQFNLGGALMGALGGIATGNAPLAIAGGLQGGFGGGPNATTVAGDFANTAGGVAGAGFLANNQALFNQQMQFQSAMNWQTTAFNEMMDQQAETMRESNVLREVAMEQRKADIGITKKFIESIG